MIEKPLNNPNLDVNNQIILYLENISVSFDGFKVIDDLNLYIEDGELRCIIGPNGAGKTTLMDIITGKTRPDKGNAYFGQKIDLLRLDEYEIAQAGIGRKFQKPTVFEKHSLFTNLRLAMSSNKNVWPTLFDRLTGVQHDYIEEVLATIGLVEQKDSYAGTLSHGQKQWLEIGMLLAQKPRLLLIDEPVAGMTHQETEHTTELLNSLMGEYSVIVVEHDMEFIRSIARKVTVLHEGRILSEGSIEKVQNDSKVIEVYLGA